MEHNIEEGINNRQNRIEYGIEQGTDYRSVPNNSSEDSLTDVFEFSYSNAEVIITTPDIYIEEGENMEESLEAFDPKDSDQRSTLIYCHCGQSFTQLETLHQHLINDHAEQSYICYVCKSSFGTPNHLNRHLIQHIDGPKFSCKYCNFKFMTDHFLNIHIKQHTDILDPPSVCHICGQTFFFKIHLSNHTCSKSYSCPYSPCIAKFTNKELLFKHVVDHSWVKRTVRYICTKCTQTFSCKSKLEKHMFIHTDSKNCVTCGLKYEEDSKLTSNECLNCCNKKSTQALQAKPISPPNEAKTIFNCEVCSRSFNFKGALKDHMVMHTKERPHECPYCSITFRWRTNLYRHLKEHTGLEPYHCSSCNSDFATIDAYKLHILNHKGIKAYECRACNHKCLKKYELERHMRVHTGIKPYVCQGCGKSFTRTTTLNHHRANTNCLADKTQEKKESDEMGTSNSCDNE